MRKIIILLLSFLISINIIAQEESKSFQVKFFPSIHFGFFNPEDVNSRIADDLSGYTITGGTSDLILSFNLGLGVGFRFANIFEVQPIVEYSIAPKIIANIDKNYSFSKLSGGLMANLLIPIAANRKHSIIVGGGMLYNSMSFENYSGSSINPRFQIGLSMNNNKFNPQILLSADFAKTTAKENENFELDYTSFRIGVNLNF